jgi:hypothetical protein
MRIDKDQIVAGYPALTVRTFLRRCRFFTIVAETAARALKTDDRQAAGFLRQLLDEGVRGYALDPENAKALWKKSEEMVGERFA